MGAKDKHTTKTQAAAGRSVKKTTRAKSKPKSGGSVAAVPDEAAIERATAKLAAADKAIVADLLRRLGRHLGSPEAARLWLVTFAPEYGKTPLEVIAAGKAALVLADVESRWGPSPTHA